jgi:hypothetical protein
MKKTYINTMDGPGTKSEMPFVVILEVIQKIRFGCAITFNLITLVLMTFVPSVFNYKHFFKNIS